LSNDHVPIAVPLAPTVFFAKVFGKLFNVLFCLCVRRERFPRRRCFIVVSGRLPVMLREHQLKA